MAGCHRSSKSVTLDQKALFSLGRDLGPSGYPARGRAGGVMVRAARLIWVSRENPLEGKQTHRVPPGDTLVVELPGGGGFGDPKERHPKRSKQIWKPGMSPAGV
ncbi:MAG: hypothetical protein Ct9H300mP16_13720 [Pseudomonadota bacterium]|nr:MAG: hypothetical protein Ct9H300mP16_13720 [Pseudomonadota bacterium]